MTITDRNASPSDTSRTFVSGRPVSPGEVLQEEFLGPLGISQRTAAQAMGIPPIRISEIVRGKRAVTADTALRFAAYLGTSPEFWLNLQAHFELSKVLANRENPFSWISPAAPT